MKEKGPPPRPHYAVFCNGERIGEVTSGTLSPSLNWGVGMAYVSSAHAKIGYLRLTSRFARKNSQLQWKRNRSTENQHHDYPRRFDLHRKPRMD
jgi:glycine cleavage system aminomethyltransferase T